MGRCTKGGETHDGEIAFWGEWEAQSELVGPVRDSVAYGPNYIYRPFYTVPSSYHGLQNTDPFVFDGFYYTCCKQHTSKGPTQLRFLKRGTVILFGSAVDDRFVLDTLLVVDRHINHEESTVVDKVYPHVPQGYIDVTLEPIYQSRDGACVSSSECFRLYFGATTESSVEGIYSFFPCLPASEADRGFARPVIELPGIINGKSKQGNRHNPQESMADVKRMWEAVIQQVEDQGLWLGVHAKMPPRE